MPEHVAYDLHIAKTISGLCRIQKAFSGQCIHRGNGLTHFKKVLALLALATSLAAQAQVQPIASVPVPANAALRVLPANTRIELEMVDAVSSKTNKPGDTFKLRVTSPVAINGIVLVPTGTAAIGQVVHAAKAGIGGKAGELILAARYLEMPQGQIKLRSTFGASGENHTDDALVLGIAFGVIGMVVKGKDLELSSGSLLSARTASDTPLSALP